MPTKQELLSNFRDSIPAWRSASTLARYPYIAGRFIDHAGVKSTYTKTDAMKFLNHLSHSGGKANYIRWAAFAIAAFYKSLELPAPFTKGELPSRPQESELVRPALTNPQVVELIRAVKSRGTSRMKAYLALSTVYGLRAIELASIKPEVISEDSIMIATAKHGVAGKQPIPAQIQKYVQPHNFKPCTTSALCDLFSNMQKLAEQKHKDKEGFHSIRRRLVRSLIDNGANPRYINLFMRWSSASRSGMMGVYSHPDESEYEAAYDNIFSKHPWLKEWR